MLYALVSVMGICYHAKNSNQSANYAVLNLLQTLA